MNQEAQPENDWWVLFCFVAVVVSAAFTFYNCWQTHKMNANTARRIKALEDDMDYL